MKILIADDHEIVTYGVKRYIQENNPEYSVDTAVNPGQMIRKLDGYPDIIVLDVGYDDIDVFELIVKIKEKLPHCRIIIYTVHEEAGLLRRLFEAGVEDIVLKSSSAKTLLRAITRAASGNPPKHNEKVLEIIKSTINAPKLTATELIVLNLIRNGLSTSEIAKHLFVSENTVETHRRHLLKKLNARNVAELIVKAQKGGW